MNVYSPAVFRIDKTGKSEYTFPPIASKSFAKLSGIVTNNILIKKPREGRKNTKRYIIQYTYRTYI